MPAQKFRSKPVIVEAMRLSENSRNEILGWMKQGNYQDTDQFDPVNIHIMTINGVVVATPGTWIIKGVQNFYPCDDKTFQARWEAINAK